jgi:glucosamine--fructose-6-phosphate aminotransferase (isomerizing)
MNLFLKEILEQPAAVEELAGFYEGHEGSGLLNRAKRIMDEKKPDQVIFTGMGSSYFVAHAASTLFSELNMKSFAINTSELLHYNLSLLDQRSLLVCISQSGESYEIRELLDRLKGKIRCIGIVNEENSTLALKAEVALLCKAGNEKMTSTKTYIGTSLVSFILGWYLVGDWGRARSCNLRSLSADLRSLMGDYQSRIGEIITFLGNISTLQIIARGPSFSTACQSALMFKEALHIPATGILGGEFRHGPMEMVSDGFRSILFAAKGATLVQSLKMAEDITGFGGKVLLITNDNRERGNEGIRIFYIDEPDEYLFSVQAIAPVQLFVDLYAKSKGFEAGSFSRGAKVTSIE